MYQAIGENWGNEYDKDTTKYPIYYRKNIKALFKGYEENRQEMQYQKTKTS